jgi:cytochrome c556
MLNEIGREPEDLREALALVEEAAKMLVAAFDAGAEDGEHPSNVKWEDLEEADRTARTALEAVDRLRNSRDPPSTQTAAAMHQHIEAVGRLHTPQED